MLKYLLDGITLCNEKRILLDYIIIWEFRSCYAVTKYFFL